MVVNGGAILLSGGDASGGAAGASGAGGGEGGEVGRPGLVLAAPNFRDGGGAGGVACFLGALESCPEDPKSVPLRNDG